MKYRCVEEHWETEEPCGWVGTEAEMKSDYIPADHHEDEIWSNWICPSCGNWAMLEDYDEM